MNKLVRIGAIALVAALLAFTEGSSIGAHEGGHGKREFERISTFVVCQNTSCDTDEVEVTLSEIVTASQNGRTLGYVDAAFGAVGFVDITDPTHPGALGVVKLDGQPTSLATAGPWLLVAVNTSADFVNTSGELRVYDFATCAANTAACAPEAVHALGGQPDSVAVSPDRRYAAIAIENERDEDVNDGELPQFPAGNLKVVRLSGQPLNWTIKTVDLTGLAAYAPDDPEPEYVSINKWNVAAVTLQENNHIALVYLPTASVIHDFPAGQVTRSGFDTEENDFIEPVGELVDVPREPDAIAWLGAFRVVTANEGDLFGGTRGFSIFGAAGTLLFDAGNGFDNLAQRHGHYPEDRSENKGTEPEGVVAARFHGEDLIFVGSERGNFVAVYEDGGFFGKPKFKQFLPTGIGPEGLLAIPQRGLFVAAAEADDAGPVRSQITIFRLHKGEASYPQVVSGPRLTGPLAGQFPIGWAALSALAADRHHPKQLFTVHDFFLDQSRLYVLDVSQKPAVIRNEIPLHKDEAPVHYDMEGLVQREEGGFWLASEGAGNAPGTRENLLVEVAADGTVLNEIALPPEVKALQRNNGFEGVAVTGGGSSERVFVAFQREWTGDPARHVRIGEYLPSTGQWRFFYYLIDPVESPTADWVGLSEVVALSDDRLLILERDNAGGPDTRNKRLYEVEVAGVTPQPQGAPFPVLTKTLVRDLLPALRATGGWTQEKVEGVAVTKDKKLYVVTDNDGVDENTGETILLRLGRLE
jgi:Esterase-like activity of phytase